MIITNYYLSDCSISYHLIMFIHSHSLVTSIYYRVSWLHWWAMWVVATFYISVVVLVKLLRALLTFRYYRIRGFSLPCVLARSTHRFLLSHGARCISNAPPGYEWVPLLVWPGMTPNMHTIHVIIANILKILFSSSYYNQFWNRISVIYSFVVVRWISYDYAPIINFDAWELKRVCFPSCTAAPLSRLKYLHTL